MTKTQTEKLKGAKIFWERVKAKITLLGEDAKGNVVCELETNYFTQKFTIGKRGKFIWKYIYNKI